jgi:subtilisin family serine protease
MPKTRGGHQRWHGRRRWLATVVLACLVVVLGFCAGTGQTSPTPSEPSPKFITYDDADVEVIPGEYLVVFQRDQVADPQAVATALVHGTGGAVDYVFTETFAGFTARHLTDAWAATVSRRADVTLVRQNFRIAGAEQRGGPFDPVPWNLDRIDQRAPLDVDRDFRYKTGPAAGAEVPIYVLDNGVNRTHGEFATASGSRVVNVADITGQNFARCSLPQASDAGHGTSIASVAAGRSLGIVPTKIMNIKVLDRDALGISCTGGSPDSVQKGLEEARKHMASTGATRAIVNLSVGWTEDTPDVAIAIAALRQAGAIVVAAAGNENVDASGTVPANVAGVLAVGGITQQNRRYVAGQGNGSNYGPTVGLWAPGSNVRAADWLASGGPVATTLVTGTSFAAPQVAGAAALLWQQEPSLTGPQVVAKLKGRATRNMLLDLGRGSDNALLFVGEDTPVKGASSTVNLPAGGPATSLSASRVSADGTRLYVTGSGATPIAAFDTAQISAGPLWSVPPSPSGDTACQDIQASESPAAVGSGLRVYFGCTETLSSGQAAMVIAAQGDNVSQWAPWREPGSTMAGITDGLVEGHGQRLYALTTEPSGSCVRAVVTAIDPDTGTTVRRQVLDDPGFAQPCNRGVDLALVDVPDTQAGGMRTELVAATYSDPPGADRTFLWRIDPETLAIEAWGEVPLPPLADPGRGMFATGLAVDPFETNGSNIQRPAHVFLATEVQVTGSGPADPESGPRGYIYRLDASLVSGAPIESVRRAMVNSIWCDSGDVFYGGLVSDNGTFGSDTRLFVAKNEGVIFNPRRWSLRHDGTDPLGLRGVVTFRWGRAYVVSQGQSSIDVTQYAAY